MSEALFKTIQNQSDINRRTSVLESAEYAVLQVGAAAPAHNAAESVLYFDTVLDDLYINADGINNWQLIAGGGGIVAAHNLLSASHPDTSAGAPVRGDVIVANATPEWAAVAIGTAHQLFKVNGGGTDPAWSSFDWDDIATAAAADMVHTHTSNVEGGTLTTAAISDLAYAVPALTLGIANAAGVANTVIRTDATILAFDAVVPNTIQPDDAAAVGVATVAARRDHEHGIVAAAPSANLSVSTTNAEGAGTSFSRNDHSHAITASSNPGAAAALLASDANGDLQLVDLTLSGNLNIAEYIYHSGDADTYIRATPDAWDVQAGGVQFLTITETTQDTIVINEGAADIDFRVEGVGQAYALFVQGSNGYVGVGVDAPAAPLTMPNNQSIGWENAAGAAVPIWINATATNALTLTTNSAQRLIIDANGNWSINDIGNDCDFRVKSSGVDNSLFVQGSDGKIGINTSVIPHGAVGLAMLALEGTDSNAAGPHVQFTTATDDYPLSQFLHWTHDNVGWALDAYWDGTWRSSDAGSNFQIYKTGDDFMFRYDSGVAQGAAITWNNGIVLEANGDVGIGTLPNSKLEIDLATENLEIVDAGSAGATEQDWIQVKVGGNTGYIRVFASV